MLTNETILSERAIASTRTSGWSAASVIYAAVIIAALLLLLSAVVWSCWIFAAGMLGAQYTVLGIGASLVTAAAYAWRTGLSFAASLIMVGFCVFTLLTAAAFGIAAYVQLVGS